MGRTVSFVQCHSFEFDGSMFQESITLADFDNDERNELCIGNVAGDLAIFKGKEKRWSAKNLGMITCLAVGDIRNRGCNSLVVITGEGLCYIFDHNHVSDFKPQKSSEEAISNGSVLKYSYKQKFPLNIKQLIIADVTNSGTNELIVILDTVVRIYAWDDGGANDAKLVHQDDKIINFESQVDAITVSTDRTGDLILVVCIPSQGISNRKATINALGTFQWEPVATSVKFNAPVTDAIGNIRKNDSEENLVSFVTLDGELKIYDGNQEIWSLELGNPIFALAKTDIDNDNTEEVIACSWDGLTFFVDHHKNIVRYKFEESVAIRAFCAGKYAIDGIKNLPTLVYVTFQGQVIVYYDVELTSLGVHTLEDYEFDLSSVCGKGAVLSAKDRAAAIRNLLSNVGKNVLSG